MKFSINSLPTPVNQKYISRSYVLNSKYRDWRDQVKEHVPRGHVIMVGDVGLQVDFYYKRERDIDSGLKCLLDGMSGCVYEDDKQVIELVVTKNKVESVEEVMTVVQIDNLSLP